ncbi:MAG: calcium/proton exchanger [Candidatus Limnocylindrales bacterium]
MTNLPVIGQLSPLSRAVVLAALIASLTAIAMEWLLHLSGTPIFLASALAILGLAYVIGLSTERLGTISGPQVGALLNAAFGNIAELIIAGFALLAGQLEVVKASITGAIIGNLLLVLGMSLLIGGARHGIQRFNERIAGLDSTLLVLAVIGLLIPAVFVASAGSRPAQPGSVERIDESVVIAIVLLVLYFVNIVYRFRHPPEMPAAGHEAERGEPTWSARTAIVVLAASATLLAILSEQLVGAIDPFVESFGLTTFFVGVIIIPTIGNLAEQLVAVRLAYADRIEFSIAVAIGATLQIALFVAPILVLMGLFVGQPMDLVFEPLEVAAVAVAAGIAALVSLDGESNWLEGALLLGVYVILAVSFYFFV